MADLEAALAMLSRKTDRTDLRRRFALAPQVCVGIFMLCVGFLLGGSAGPSATAQSGPSKVVAPFSVVDNAGHELFRVASASGAGVAFVYGAGGNAQVILGSPGSGKPQIQVLSSDGSLKAGLGLRSTEGDGVLQLWGGKTKAGTVIYGQGQLYMYNAQAKTLVNLGISDPEWSHLALAGPNGNEQVTLGASPGSGKPQIQVLAPDGNLRAGIGINTEGYGAVGLKSAGQTSLWLTGNGLLQGVNAQGKKVVHVGVSGTGAGDFYVFNSSGKNVVGISAEQGPGVIQLFNTGGQERVTLGTLGNGKGDVCASGDQGANCLSRLNPKY